MFKKNTLFIGFVLSIALAAGSIALWLQFFSSTLPASEASFHIGVDVMGAFVCMVLYCGCMWQEELATRSFNVLIIMTGAAFFINEVMWFTAGAEQWRTLYFACCLMSKCLNLAMIYLFFLYVRNTLRFEGKTAQWADRWFPVLLLVSILIVLSNVFGQVTFTVDPAGIYGPGNLPWLEDLYLMITSLVTTVLIVRCQCPRRQKWAAMSFILIPVAEFIASGGAFAYSTQYGAVMLSIILMYCILFNDRSRKLAATQTELTMATDIQKAMIPSIFPAFPERKEFDLYAVMDPAKEVGGDFYDFFLIDDDHLGLIIADVSGKGVPAALFMMISKTIIQNYAKLGIGAAKTLERTNRVLSSGNDTNMFVTTWIGILEISSGVITCANAGHEYPAVCHNGRFELLKDRHGFVLGGMEGSKYKEYTISMKKGDKLFVYTDGVPEATNTENDMFGVERMLETLNRRAGASPDKILKVMRKAVDEFAGGAEQFDDLTMLCLEYKGAE